MGDDSLERRIVVALRRITRAIDRYSRRLAEEYGLTATQLAVLRELSDSGELPPSDIARRVHLSQASVSEIVKHLESQRFVERRRSETDRRQITCSITPNGSEIASSSPSLLQERFMAELSRLPDWEQSSLLAALQRVARMMDAEGLEAGPILASGPATATPQETARFLREPANIADGEPEETP